MNRECIYPLQGTPRRGWEWEGRGSDTSRPAYPALLILFLATGTKRFRLSDWETNQDWVRPQKRKPGPT